MDKTADYVGNLVFFSASLSKLKRIPDTENKMFKIKTIEPTFIYKIGINFLER